MLPGIRFLFAAIVLSASILIFGLGAAALLRAAHDEVANIPARRVMAEPIFPQPEAAVPTLAMLRLEADRAPEAPPGEASPVEPVAESMPGDEAQRLAALTGDDFPPAQMTTPEAAIMQETNDSGTARTEMPIAGSGETVASLEARPAALEAASPATDVARAEIEQVASPAVTDAGALPTRTAALGDPAATAENAAETKQSNEKPNRAEIRRQQRAERARERRRQAARRARLAAQQAATQQAANPFSQSMPFTQPATAVRRR